MWVIVFKIAYCFNFRYSELDAVNIREATPSQLFSYHHEKDLLPLIVSHCNYSLAVGEVTTLKYDYMELDKLVHQNFIKGRCKLYMQVRPAVFGCF